MSVTNREQIIHAIRQSSREPKNLDVKCIFGLDERGRVITTYPTLETLPEEIHENYLIACSIGVDEIETTTIISVETGIAIDGSILNGRTDKEYIMYTLKVMGLDNKEQESYLKLVETMLRTTAQTLQGLGKKPTVYRSKVGNLKQPLYQVQVNHPVLSARLVFGGQGVYLTAENHIGVVSALNHKPSQEVVNSIKELFGVDITELDNYLTTINDREDILKEELKQLQLVTGQAIFVDKQGYYLDMAETQKGLKEKVDKHWKETGVVITVNTPTEDKTKERATVYQVGDADLDLQQYASKQVARIHEKDIKREYGLGTMEEIENFIPRNNDYVHALFNEMYEDDELDVGSILININKGVKNTTLLRVLRIRQGDLDLYISSGAINLLVGGYYVGIHDYDNSVDLDYLSTSMDTLTRIRKEKYEKIVNTLHP